MAVTLKDISKIAGVSTATVSKVLNNKTEDVNNQTAERVRKAANSLGYVPNAMARAVKTNKSNIIGLIIPYIENPFFTDVAKGATIAAYELGYSLFLCTTEGQLEKEIQYIKSLYGLRIDGIIIAGAADRNKLAENFPIFNIPLISLDRQVHYQNISASIQTNNYQSSKEMIEILYNNGYRSYFYLGGTKTDSISQERYEGNVAGLKDKRVDKFDSVFGEFSLADGYKLIINKDNIREYDIIICGNDLIAIGVVNALRDLDIQIPNEISVVGFDDIKLASSIFPKLTTIKQPSYDMGYKSVYLINDIVNGSKTEKIYKLDQELKFRDTTKSIIR